MITCEIRRDSDKACVHLVPGFGGKPEADHAVFIGEASMVFKLDHTHVVQVACVARADGRIPPAALLSAPVVALPPRFRPAVTRTRTFVGNQDHGGKFCFRECAMHKTKPVFEVPKTIVIGDVVDEQNGLRPRHERVQ